MEKLPRISNERFPACPKCGSKKISNVAVRLRSMSKHYPEADPPKDKAIRPVMDFNHPYFCNSCGHYFGGSWGG